MQAHALLHKLLLLNSSITEIYLTPLVQMLLRELSNCSHHSNRMQAPKTPVKPLEYETALLASLAL
jgi:hypothetical protein